MGEVVKGRLISNNVAIGSSVGGSLAQRAYSPTVELTETEDGVRIEMTDVNGIQEVTVYNGQDYVLTEEDKEEIADIAKDSMDYDDVPTDASDNLMTSGAIKDALDLKADKTELPVNVSELNNDAGYLTQHQDISGKQDKLTFDNTPKAFSSNPVTSAGVYDAVRDVSNDVSTLKSEMVTAKFDIGLKVNKSDVESTLSSSSVNPVQNKTIKAALDLKADKTEVPQNVSDLANDAGYLTAHQDISGKQDKLTFDNAPTAFSSNPVKSSGIYDAIRLVDGDVSTLENDMVTVKFDIGTKVNKTDVESALSSSSVNPVQNKVVKAALDLKADKTELPTKVSDLTDDSGHYTKPANGIPAGDLASGIIPTIIVNSTAQEKEIIRTAIGAENGDDIVKVQDTQPSGSATKIWIPETMPEGVVIPTVSEVEDMIEDAIKENIGDISVITADVATIQAAASDAEAYTQGTRNGTAVGSSDPVYHNNAKYYSEMAFAGTPDGYDALATDVSDIKRDFVRISNQAIDELFES